MSVIELGFIKSALVSQYKASLLMLRSGVEICSPEVWLSGKYSNPTWQMVYHALFFVDLYLYPKLDAYRRWDGFRKGYEDFENTEISDPYTQGEILEFITYIENRLVKAVNILDLTSKDCGFYWYKVNKLEHQLVNLKHLQHHLGQLQDRIRNEQNQGIGWIRDGSGDVRQD